MRYLRRIRRKQTVDIGLVGDTSNSSGLTVIVSDVHHGRFDVLGKTDAPVSRFAQGQIEAGLVQFVHEGSRQAPAYAVRVSDGLTTSPAQPTRVLFTPRLVLRLHLAKATTRSGKVNDDSKFAVQ